MKILTFVALMTFTVQAWSATPVIPICIGGKDVDTTSPYFLTLRAYSDAGVKLAMREFQESKIVKMNHYDHPFLILAHMQLGYQAKAAKGMKATEAHKLFLTEIQRIAKKYAVPGSQWRVLCNVKGTPLPKPRAGASNGR